VQTRCQRKEGVEMEVEIKIGDLFINDDHDAVMTVTTVLPPVWGQGEPRIGLDGSTPIHFSWWLGQGWSPCTQEEWDQVGRGEALREQLDRDWES
jgi:hypothetical protein